MTTRSLFPRSHGGPLARRDILWTIVAFLGLQLGLAVALRTCWTELRDPTYDARAERLSQRLDAAAPRPVTVVMVGSSRANDGFQGQVLEANVQSRLEKPLLAFSLAIPGGGPLRELLTVRRLLEAGIRPDLLIVEVNPLFLSSQEGTSSEIISIAPQRLRSSELQLLEGYGAPGERRRDWWQAHLIPWHGFRFSLMSRVFPAGVPADVREDLWFTCDGWGSFERPLDEQTVEVRQRRTEAACQHFRSGLTDFRLGGTGCRALRDLLELCRRERIAAVLVVMPEGEAFRALYPATARCQIQEFYGELQRVFDTPLIDASSWVADDGFLDSHHLTPRGASVFTARLAQEVLPMLTKLIGHPGAPSVKANTEGWTISK